MFNLFPSKSANGNAVVNITKKNVNKAVNVAGNVAVKTVNSANSAVESLKTVAAEMDKAGAQLEKNANVLGSYIAEHAPHVQKVASQNAGWLSPMIGGGNMAIIGGMPKSVISMGAARLVKEAGRQLRRLSGSARKGAEALKGGIRVAGEVADMVNKNVKPMMETVNSKAVTVANSANSLAAEHNIPAAVKVEHMDGGVERNIRHQLANLSAAAKPKKMNGGSRKNKTSRKDRKNRKNRKDRKNKTSKKGGFFSSFF